MITTRDPDDPKQACFVIMPYSEDFNLVLDAIKDAVQSAGLRCNRLDEVSFTGPITDEMVERIAKSKICIADLTGPNQNVMWEAGYAMALNRPTVLISQDVTTVPFNLKNYPVLRYDLSKGRRAVALEIAAAIRATLALASARKRRVARWITVAAVAPFAVAAGLWFSGIRIETTDPDPPPGSTSCRCDLIHLDRSANRVNIVDDIAIQLHDVDTFEGKSEPGKLSGHAFNKENFDKDNLFVRILRAVGISEGEAARMSRMSQDDWDKFIASNGEKGKDLIARPLARLSVFRGSETLIDAKYFLEGELLPEIKRNGRPPIAFELKESYNTKIKSDESVALRLVTAEVPHI